MGWRGSGAEGRVGSGERRCRSARRPRTPILDRSCRQPSLFEVPATSVSQPFRYTVHNRYSRDVRIFRLGFSDSREMYICSENIPRRVDSPAGWEGQHIFLHESEYMQIFWNPLSLEAEIPPGDSRSGFDVEMPERSGETRKLFNSSGREVEPIDMKRAPFQVIFADGKCTWGHARETRTGDPDPSQGSM